MKRRCARSQTAPRRPRMTASVRPKRSKEMRRVGALTGIAAHADASEVGVGHIVVTSGRRWFLCCNLAGGRLGKPAKDYDEQGLPDILWRACPQRRCPRNNTWHRPKLSTAVRDRSVRTQCTSLSHGGARAPEKTLRPLSEDKTASTIFGIWVSLHTCICIYLSSCFVCCVVKGVSVRVSVSDSFFRFRVCERQYA